MPESIFTTKNLNSKIFQVPGEEGPEGLDLDNSAASIGDATARHVSSLSASERLLWESFVVMPNGNIFEMTEDLGYARKAESITDFTSTSSEELGKLTKQLELELEFHQSSSLPIKLMVYKTKLPKYFAAKEELSRRQSEDALVRGELIPYEDWERNPQMLKYWSTPGTPRQKAIFIGSCQNRFLDYWPSAHPRETQISIVLSLLDKPGSELLEPHTHTTRRGRKYKFEQYFQYICWLVKQWVKLEVVSEALGERLTNLIEKVVGSSDPDSEVIRFLGQEDELAGKFWRAECKNRTLREDKMYLFLAEQKKKILGDKKTTPRLKLRAISKLGISLWKHRGRLRLHHWNLYRSLKQNIRIPCNINGIDINKATSIDLARALFRTVNLTTVSQAQEVILKRPYLTKEKFWQKSPYHPLCATEQGNSCLLLIQKGLQQALLKRDKKILTTIPWELIGLQKRSQEIPPTDWETIWTEYNWSKGKLWDILYPEKKD